MVVFPHGRWARSRRLILEDAALEQGLGVPAQAPDFAWRDAQTLCFHCSIFPSSQNEKPSEVGASEGL